MCGLMGWIFSRTRKSCVLVFFCLARGDLMGCIFFQGLKILRFRIVVSFEGWLDGLGFFQDLKILFFGVPFSAFFWSYGFGIGIGSSLKKILTAPRANNAKFSVGFLNMLAYFR